MVSLANPGAMYVMPDLIDLPETRSASSSRRADSGSEG